MSEVPYSAKDIRKDGLLKISKLREREPSNEQKYYDALKLIAKGYDTAERVLKRAEKDWGCDEQEALVMAYENIQNTAATAIKGKKRPK